MTEPKKRCLYEVLGLSHDCSQDEIRSAYRRLALQLHPDKLAQSAGVSPSAATAAFQELVHAYEVLSDPKERAWYDSHRSQILFSDPSSTSKSHKPSSFFDLDLFSFFSNSAFSGYTDTGKGFYKVYGDLFAKIYAQELWFVKELGLASDSVLPAPLIGNLECQYSQVTAFYNHWLGFCTVMDFGWMDEYDASIGPNRRSRRLMEEENKKARKKARREYNDTVRGLAAFVKKRDKRVRDMQLKKSLEEEKRRAEEKARKKEEERKKMERAQMYEEPDWAKIDDEVEELILKGEFIELDDGKKKKEKGSEEFYCVVCNKKFKSDKQWKNHEQSKKHRDKVAELKFPFQEEAEEVMEDGDDIEKFNVGFDYKPVESEDSVVDELCEELMDDFRLKEEEIEGGDLEEIDKKLDSDDDEATILEAMVSGRRNRKNDYLYRHDSSAGKVFHHDDDDEKSSMGYDTSRTMSTATRRGNVGEGDDEALREETSASAKDDNEVQNQEVNAEELEEDASCNSEEATARRKVKLWERIESLESNK